MCVPFSASRSMPGSDHCRTVLCTRRGGHQPHLLTTFTQRPSRGLHAEQGFVCNLLSSEFNHPHILYPPRTSANCLLWKVLEFRGASLPQPARCLILPLLYHPTCNSREEVFPQQIILHKEFLVPFHVWRRPTSMV